MRFVVVAGLLCALMVGLGYTYGQDSSVPAFLTAVVERGSISTLVKASGTVEAVVSVDVSSQLSGRIAEVFVNFNDSVTAGQPIAQIDQEIFAARVNEARAALRVARATAEVQKAALERAKVAVTNAQTAEKLAEAQSAANKARQDEAERDLVRKLELARTGSGTERDLSQVRALRDAGAADLRASLEQIQMKAEAIAIAEAEERMAEANLDNAQAVVEQRQAASIRHDLISIVPSFAHRLMESSSSGMSIQDKRSPSVSKPKHCSRSRMICGRWRSTARSTRPMSGS